MYQPDQSFPPCLLSLVYCIVCGCNSRTNPNRSYFRFPKDVNRCLQWKENVSLPNIMDFDSETCYKRYRVCSLHFEDSMFASIQKNKLKKDAFPKLCLQRKSTIEGIDKPHVESPTVSTISLPAEPKPGTSKDMFKLYHNNAAPDLPKILKVTGDSVYSSNNEPHLKPPTFSTVFIPVKQQPVMSNDTFEQYRESITPKSTTTLPVEGGSIYSHVQTQTAASLESRSPRIQQLRARIKFLQRQVRKQTCSRESSCCEKQVLRRQSDLADDGSDVELSNSKMVLKNCCVKGCKTTYKNLSPNLRLFHFPKNIDRIQIWAENCDRKDVGALSVVHAYNHGVCSLHFEDDMFMTGTRARLKKTAVPTIFTNIPSESREIGTNSAFSHQHVNLSGEISDEEIVGWEEKSELYQKKEEYRCRTCLNVVYRDTCVNITRHCYLSNTVKEVILLLVPKMASTLNGNQVVCNDCLKILTSSITFITKCLAIEAALQNANVVGDISQIDTEHDYCRKISTVGDIQQIGGLNSINKDISNEALGELSADDNEKVFEDCFYDIKICNHSSKKKKKKTTPQTTKENKQGEPKYSCTVCPDSFATREDYDLHLQIHPPHVCDVCGRAFAKSASLVSHKYTHNERNFICEVCGKRFKDPSALRTHLNTHIISNESFECNECKKVFNKKISLRAHVKRVHSEIDGAQCPYCGILLKRRATLLSHIKLRHGNGETYECDICNKKFARTDYLRNHMSRHTKTAKPRINKGPRLIKDNDNQPVPCKLCGRWCGNVRKLRLHLYTHMNRFRCQFCPLTFARKALCQRHEKVHEGGKVIFFRCNSCWKRFKTKEALDEHAARHSNPLYSCDLCEKTFNRRFLLYHHRRVDHDDFADESQAREIIHESLLQVSKASEEPVM